jgi:hypothetical protein
VKAYLASAYSRRLEMCSYAEQLQSRGHQVTSEWIRGGHEATNEDLARDPDLPLRFAQDDLKDLLRADTVICFTQEPGASPRNRGGRHVEFGIALGWNEAMLANAPISYPEDRKRIVVIGPVENVFYALPEAGQLVVERFGDWQSFVATVEHTMFPEARQ